MVVAPKSGGRSRRPPRDGLARPVSSGDRSRWVSTRTAHGFGPKGRVARTRVDELSRNGRSEVLSRGREPHGILSQTRLACYSSLEGTKLQRRVFPRSGKPRAL